MSLDNFPTNKPTRKINKVALSAMTAATFLAAACSGNVQTSNLPTRQPTVTRTPLGSELTTQPTLEPTSIPTIENTFIPPTEIVNTATPAALNSNYTEAPTIFVDEGDSQEEISNTQILEVPTFEPTADLISERQLPFDWFNGVGFYMSVRDKNGNLITDPNDPSFRNTFNVRGYGSYTKDELKQPGGPFVAGNNNVLLVPGDQFNNFGVPYTAVHSGTHGGVFLQGEPFRNFIEGLSFYQYSHYDEIPEADLVVLKAREQAQIEKLIGGQLRMVQGTGKDMVEVIFSIEAASIIEHEYVPLFDANTGSVIDIAQQFDLIRPELWEQAKNSGQWFILSTCLYGGQNDDDWSSYRRVVLLFRVKQIVHAGNAEQ